MIKIFKGYLWHHNLLFCYSPYSYIKETRTKTSIRYAREIENITRKVNTKLLQEIITSKGNLVYYDTKAVSE